ncbi:MAG: sigma-54-dependent Fis family transcriptional regulator [Acidobacteria bacterium]|nr:sigma-54-dependent Fis family transcriptional regulator [Acidobacteriota bacterium]
MPISILFVEDDERIRTLLVEAALMEGYQAEGLDNAEEALTALARQQYDILVTDVTLPGMSGLDLLQHCQRLSPGIIPIVITGYGTVDYAIEAMKRGATDFLTKPFDLDTLLSIVRVAAERVARHALSTSSTGKGLSAIDLIAESAAMKKVLGAVQAIAPFNTTVLITGGTGTGKEIIARSLHQHSPRRAAPLVALNCAAVPEQLLEDELFGHVKGAFTGAQTARKGRFEQADGGTLFLDEIGDMSLPLQSKLLRVLQEREFERLGSSSTIRVDVRIVAATSANLERSIADGSFRPDLYYRLNVVHLPLPPLKERREDIRPLAEHFLARFCESVGLPAKTMVDEVWDALLASAWPGNVRQLQNAMERAAALSGASPVIHLQDLPEELRGASASGSGQAEATQTLVSAETTIPNEGVSFDEVINKVERELLLQALGKAGGNKMRAAKLLKMKRTTFLEKLKRLQLNVEETEE